MFSIKNSLFIESFKEPKKLIYVTLLEILFIASVVLILIAASFAIRSELSSLNKITNTMLSIMPLMGKIGDSSIKFSDSFKQEVKDSKTTLVNVIRNSVLIAVIAYLLLLLDVAFFKSMQWANILGKKISKPFIRKFTITSFLWLLAWSSLISITALIFKTKAAAYLVVSEILLLICFTAIFYSIFDEKLKFINLVKKTFKVGFRKFYSFILPILLEIAVFILLLLFLRLALFLIKNGAVIAIVAMIILLFYLSWMRIYTSLVAKKAVSKC